MHALPRMRRASRAVRLGETDYGKGVFARRRFQARELIGVVGGVVINDLNYSSDYCMGFGDEAILEPAAPFRYVNHSCEPNCELVFFQRWDEKTSSDFRELVISAISSIQRGEQLTLDYGWTAAAAIPCACGCVNCRGWIVAQDELERLAARQQSSRNSH